MSGVWVRTCAFRPQAGRTIRHTKKRFHSREAVMTLSAKAKAFLVVVATTMVVSTTPAMAQPSNVVIQWNQILQSLFGPGPGLHVRAMPMMHIAMFDAINSIEDVYTPYYVQVKASRGASAEAAAAQAAYEVLVSMYSSSEAVFRTARDQQYASLPPGVAQQSLAIGHQVAVAILARRAGDGWPLPPLSPGTPDPTYVLPPFPGLWQPTPPADSRATFTFFPKVTPFALFTSTQFLPPPPPVLTSTRYAVDFNETKEVGSITSLTRTADQTTMSRLFAGVTAPIGFFHVWNRVAATIAEQKGLSLIDTARLFVLVNVSIHDGVQTSFTSKFTYGLWRPVTAIRRADEDLNPATVADATWTPLLTTPTYPSYAGNAACISAAAARALELAFDDATIPFSVTWPLNAGGTLTRDFTGFWDLFEQAARSRIHGGIHYQFDSDASKEACTKVANFINTHYVLRQGR
jgi:hypothetical protein